MGTEIKVCVLGAGVIGLTSATLLQERRPDLKVGGLDKN